MMEEAYLPIRELSKLTGISREALRFYDKIGRLSPQMRRKMDTVAMRPSSWTLPFCGCPSYMASQENGRPRGSSACNTSSARLPSLK